MAISKIAVLGAGHGGQASAGSLALSGFEVNLFELPEFKQGIEPILKRGGIDVKRASAREFAKLNIVTTDIERALKDVDLVVVTVPAYGHQKMIGLCIPHLEDGQRILLHPGHPGGALESYVVLKQWKVEDKVEIGETNTLAYMCRITGPGEVTIFLVTKKLFAAAFPALETSKLVDDLKKVFPATVAATNVMETGLEDLNCPLHVPVTLMNAARVEFEKGAFPFYREGATPSVAKMIERVDKERLAIARALKLREISYQDLLFESGWMSSPQKTVYEALATSDPLKPMSGPNSLQHRYITEDVPYGLVPYVSIGEMLGIDMPITRAFVDLACAVNEVNYWASGRTVEKLHIAGLDTHRLSEFLRTGKM